MQDRLPSATAISDAFDRLIAWMTGLSPRTAMWVSFGTTAVLCGLQVFEGTGYSLTALALLPIAFASWTLGARAGFAVAAALASVAIYVNGAGPAFAPHLKPTGFAAGWNIGMRVFASTFNVMLVAGFRRTFDIERWRARHDGLTGAVNKQVFLANLDHSLAAFTNSGRALALAYLDLDGFKQVNDRYGHSAGDEVLVRFAQGAEALLRPHDCFARFGGDEFVILVSAADHGGAVRAIESIHARLTRLLRDLPYGVTCSTGAVVLSGGMTLDRATYVRLADELMYEVKRSGRNALRIAAPTADDTPELRRKAA